MLNSKLKPFIMHINEGEEKLNKIRTKKMLVGNKTDLLSNRERERLVRSKEIREIVEKYSSMPQLFCSALEGTGISQIFEEITKLIINDTKIGLIENELKEAVKSLIAPGYKI
jgi:predicted GTPase